jgi:lipopolysaccharide assembly outer membrane protein LptD (OstA)
MIRRAGLLMLVLGSNPVLDAQITETKPTQQEPTVPSGIRRMSGGVTISTIENVEIKADAADYDEGTGEISLHGTVLLRQQLRPSSQPMKATNRAGAPFPEPAHVIMRMRGEFQISIGDFLTMRADEADVNGLTGEMTLRGNVKMIRLRK